MFLLLCVPEDVARFPYTRGSGEYSKVACPLPSGIERTQGIQGLLTGFQEAGLRVYGRAKFSTSAPSRHFLQQHSQAEATTMSFRAKKREAARL